MPSCVNSITVKVWGAGGVGGASWSQKANPYNGSFGETLEACATGGGGGGGGFSPSFEL